MSFNFERKGKAGKMPKRFTPSRLNSMVALVAAAGAMGGASPGRFASRTWSPANQRAVDVLNAHRAHSWKLSGLTKHRRPGDRPWFDPHEQEAAAA